MSESTNENIFYGEHRYQIDEKMRIRIPAKFKEMLGEKPFFICGPGKRILVYNQAAATGVLEGMFKGLKPANNKKNMAQSLIGSFASRIDEDKQGRYVLPSKLIKHAEINRNAVFIGAIYHAEIWSEENWNRANEISSEEYDSLFEAFDDEVKENQASQKD